MARKARKISAQTRVKLSQAAKKRRRGLKGTPLGGKFVAGAMTAAHRGIRADIGEGGNPYDPRDIRDAIYQGSPKSAGGGHIGRKTKLVDPHEARAFGTEQMSQADRLVRDYPQQAAREIARERTNRYSGRTRVDPNKDAASRADIGHEPVRIRSGAQRDIEDMIKQQNWREGHGAYETPSKKTPRKFIDEELSRVPEHRNEFQKLYGSPNSEFWKGYEDQFGKGPTPAAVTNRVRLYTERLQEGASHTEAYSQVGKGRGRPAGPSDRPRGDYAPRKVPARRNRYDSAQPRANEFEFGIAGRHVESMADLKRRKPDASEDELLRVQQWQREDIFKELQKNQKWAHETQRANVLNEQGGKGKEDDDRVVFFTTNLGSPAPSVPADSLVGQYIIRKRKKMMAEAGVPKSQLRGAFPQAVRDMHLFERSFGVQYAVEGRHGAYKQTGWRYKNKTSRGYGKPTPIGSQIMYDSAGRPTYDAQGNIRFTEGATRPFRGETPLAGLRLFIG